MKLFIGKVIFAFKTTRNGTGILSNVKLIISKKENRISFSQWTDEKSGKSKNGIPSYS